MKAVGIVRRMWQGVPTRSSSWTAILLIAVLLITNVIGGPALAARPGSLDGGAGGLLVDDRPQSVATPPILLVPATGQSPAPQGQEPAVPPPAPVIPPAVEVPRTASAEAQTTVQPGPLQTGPFGVSRLAYSADGSVLALGTAFGIYLYDTQNSQPVGRLETGGAVSCVAFSPDGTLLAAGSFVNDVQLWRLSDGQLERDLQAPGGQVNGVAFSPDGTLLAEASTDNQIRLWNVADGALVRTLAGHTGPVLTVAFAPDGLTLVSGGADGAVRTWSVSSGVSTASAVGAVGGVTRAVYSPDGSLIALGSGDGTVRFWQVKGGNEPLATLTGHQGGITDLSFNTDGTLLASASIDGTVRLWQVPGGKLVTILPADTGALSGMAIQPEGHLLITFSYSGDFRLWDLSGLQPATATCVDNVEFVADVTVPDNSVVPSGSPFEKIWRVLNSGTCTWTPNYRVAFVSGAQMGGSSSQPLITVEPNATVDIAVQLVAPAEPGLYQGIWRLVNPAGQPFGPGLGVAIQSGVPSPFPVVNIGASATNINAGDYVTIQATALNTVQAWLDGAPLVNGFLQETVQLCGTTTFTVDGLLPDGTHITQSVTVTVNGSCGGGGGEEPDLKIKDLEASTVDPEVGEVVHFRARVKNEGDADSDDFDLKWRPSESASYYTVGNDLQLDEDEDTWVYWDYTYYDTGTFETKARIKYNDDETTRTLTIHVHALAGPDVIIDTLTADHTTVLPGDVVHLTVVVRNRGLSAASAYRLIWKPSGASPFLLLSNNVNLAAGDSGTYNFDYTFSQPGTYATQAVVSSIAQTNSKSLQIVVSGVPPTLGAPTSTPTPGPAPTGNPDLVISDLSANPAAPLNTDEVVFTAVVKNNGDGPANGFRLLWRPSPDAPFEIEADNQNLPASGQIALTFNHTFGMTGTFETEAVVEFIAVHGLALSQAPAVVADSNSRILVVNVGPMGSSIKKLPFSTPTATPSLTATEEIAPAMETPTPVEPSTTETVVETPAIEPSPTEATPAAPSEGGTPEATEPAPVILPTVEPPAPSPAPTEADTAASTEPTAIPPAPPAEDTPVVIEPTPIIMPTVPPAPPAEDTPVVIEPTPIIMPTAIPPAPPADDTPAAIEPTPVPVPTAIPPAPPPAAPPAAIEPTPMPMPTVAPPPPPVAPQGVSEPSPAPTLALLPTAAPQRQTDPRRPRPASQPAGGQGLRPKPTSRPALTMATPIPTPFMQQNMVGGSANEPGPTAPPAPARTGRRQAPRSNPPTPTMTMTPEPPPPASGPEGAPSGSGGE